MSVGRRETGTDPKRILRSDPRIHSPLPTAQALRALCIRTHFLRRDLLLRLQKYEVQQEIPGERNSYSKREPDAAIFEMKAEHNMRHRS